MRKNETNKWSVELKITISGSVKERLRDRKPRLEKKEE